MKSAFSTCFGANSRRDRSFSNSGRRRVFGRVNREPLWGSDGAWLRLPSEFLVARNRLTKITDRATYSGDPTQVVDYLYDLENRWIGKRVDTDGDGMFDSQEGYVYDGNQMVLQFEGDDLSHRYLWQPDAVDQLMADEQVADEVVLTLTDHLGTVRDLAVMDGDETSVVNHITYDAYGKKLSETSAVDCLFGFTGRAFDEVTNIQNNLHRWYDAKVGRWVSKDPIGFEGRDANPYRYVGNVPINNTVIHQLCW